MNLIDRVIADGKQVIVLVPEISLTPQMMELFICKYGRRVAVLHSGLAIGERMDEWKRIKRGDARIVVGTRSAVFAPCDNLGLIVMDEEQEHTYKSESNPRYHARDIARFRCAHHKALLLLTSVMLGYRRLRWRTCAEKRLVTALLVTSFVVRCRPVWITDSR